MSYSLTPGVSLDVNLYEANSMPRHFESDCALNREQIQYIDGNPQILLSAAFCFESKHQFQSTSFGCSKGTFWLKVVVGTAQNLKSKMRPLTIVDYTLRKIERCEAPKFRIEFYKNGFQYKVLCISYAYTFFHLLLENAC